MILLAPILLLAALPGNHAGNPISEVLELGIKYSPLKNVIPQCVFGVDSIAFVMYTKQNTTGIFVDNYSTNLPLNSTSKVIFMIPGFMSDANATNFYDLKTAILSRESCCEQSKNNVVVFSLDWANSSCSTGLTLANAAAYGDAVENVPPVGELLARFIYFLCNQYPVCSKIELIGHSLGAHVAGIASKYLQKDGIFLRRIVALDPAGVAFESKNCSEKLCKTDAREVLAIKTSALYGMENISAHIVVIMNGGSSQPGCITQVCSHSRATVIYKDSLFCPIIGIKHYTISTMIYQFLAARCTSDTCVIVGPKAFKGKARGTFY